MIDLSTVLGNIAKSIVDHPEKVVVTEHAEGNEILMTLSVAEEDMGMIIGKRGKIAKAIRTVMKAVAKIDNRKVTVEIK
ncbi:MAG: KH domain-containing protein [Clostridia bacterium]|nr:KH domain-containing protein [Clostridia bacterium]MBQ7788162.1 KH domain-containing protein [Clostridia bacterium]